MATIFIIEASDSPVRLHVNGRDAVVLVGVDSELDDIFLPALDNGGIRWRRVGETAEIEAPADDGFDADAVIEGTIDDVEPRLAELSNEQLQRVIEAEDDREAPRKGIRSAIEKLINSRNEAG